MECTHPLYYSKVHKKVVGAADGYRRIMDRKYGTPIACGRCMACRINKKREWTSRIVLEASSFSENLFITLTYDDENLPAGGHVLKRDLQLFFKRMRKAGEQFRYFAVGEYGDKSWRPHYHVCLFGLGVHSAPVIQRCWPHGFTQIGELNNASAAYAAGYCIKKMTNKHDSRLMGRPPEFILSSRAKPGGIGASALSAFIKHFTTNQFQEVIPRYFKLGGKNMPLGRYLVSKLTEATGMAPDDCKALIHKEYVLFEKCGFDVQKLRYARRDLDAIHRYRNDVKHDLLSSRKL